MHYPKNFVHVTFEDDCEIPASKKIKVRAIVTDDIERANRYRRIFANVTRPTKSPR